MAARAVPTIPVFTSGQKLRASYLTQLGTFMTFLANPPMFRMHQTLAQSVSNNTYTQITMDTSDWDTDSGRGSSSPWSYTIPIGGRWQFAVKIEWAPNNTGSRLATIAKNGTMDPTVEIAVLPSDVNFTPGVVAVATLSVNTGDIMSAWGLQNSGGSLNTASGASGKSFFEGRLVSLANP